MRSTARARTGAAHRVYEVVAGVPGPTYLSFSSDASLANFDRMMTDGEKTLKSASKVSETATMFYSRSVYCRRALRLI